MAKAAEKSKAKVSEKAVTKEQAKLSIEQTKKALAALLKHLEKEAEADAANGKKKNLLAEDPDVEKQALYLVISTKKYLSDKPVFKPKRITVPHPIFDADSTSICLLTKDPQRLYKDVLLADDSPVKDDIARIVGVSKLKTKFKTFEARRQLRDDHDIFLADDRIVPSFPELLGKTFISVKKFPVAISLRDPHKIEKPDPKGKKRKLAKDENPSDQTEQEKSAISTKRVKSEIKRTLNSALVVIPAGANTTVKFGFSTFTVDQLAENIQAIVDGLVKANVIKQGWDGVRSLHIKSGQSISLPIYLADKLE
ncbi:ribosomal protein L1/ribosomal biogenesis protein [Lipomyces japonicus]|uniref:ribosomal protein L1/ribosomal biogenesis protein n=1 Tax=Lipomyces japonicus TaxID=56871 RepID=UPI0034CDFE77